MPKCLLALPALLFSAALVHAAPPKAHKTASAKPAEVVEAPAELPPELLTTWSQFQAAIKANDVRKLAASVRFPLHSTEFGGDIESAKVLAERYKSIFPAKTRECLLAATPDRYKIDKKTYYSVGCDVGDYPINFYFEKVGAGFALTGIDNINE